MSHLRTQYKLKLWRPFFDIGICYTSFAICVVIGTQWPWALPLCLLVIANRLLALSLICHEGLHGLLFKNQKINNFVGRWLCAFPTCISFSKYKKLHLMHHRNVGNPKYDPDFQLYSFYPINKNQYFWQQVKDLLTFRTTLKFIHYYTELFDFLALPRKDLRSKLKQKIASSDFVEFMIFHTALSITVFSLGVYKEFFIFFILPLLSITQPYVLLMGGLQHGPLQMKNSPELDSRSIYGSKISMEILLPLNINYHAEHHLNSAIPHYWLKTYSRDLIRQNKSVWFDSYTHTLDTLLKKT